MTLTINRQINEAQAKVYFGWVPESKMLSEYSHLMSSDVNDAILAMHGVKKGEEKKSPMTAKQCSRCKRVNSGTAKFCQECGSPLDVKTALELDEGRKISDDFLSVLMKIPEIQKLHKRMLKETGLREKLMESVG